MLAPARRDGRLLRQQRSEILIADLRRRQDEDENGETEGGNSAPFGPLRNGTIRYSRNATRHSQGNDDDADLLKIDLSATADD